PDHATNGMTAGLPSAGKPRSGDTVGRPCPNRENSQGSAITTNHEPDMWQLPDRVLRFDGRPLVMGIVNVTPDSFSDGGRHATPEAAIAHGLNLLEQGADLLDIGGESSRPGAVAVSVEEEMRRVVPVVAGLVARGPFLLSVDTWKAAVARESLA